MTKDELKKVRSYYYSLENQKKMLEEVAAAGHAFIKDKQFYTLKVELDNIEKDFPKLLPQFTASNFYNLRAGGNYYDIPALRAYLGAALGSLKVEIESPESTPVAETRDFSFVSDANLRKVIERDYSEIQRAYVAQCWKSVIILSGGAIEAMLLDLLQQNQSAAIAAIKAPNKPDITKWDLADLINVSVELQLVSAGVEKLSHSVREYRNLVHPGNEVRNKLTFDAEEAKIALEVLNMVQRDLCL